MIIFDRNSFDIYQNDIKIFQEEIKNTIIKHFNFEPKSLKIRYSKRLTVSMGMIKVNPKNLNRAPEIILSMNARQKFGIDRIVKTFRHELAHYVTWIMDKKIDHDKKFKDICKLFKGSLPRHQISSSEYDECLDDRYLTKKAFSYSYICNCGTNNFKTRYRMKKSMMDRECINCGTKIRDMEIKL